MGRAGERPEHTAPPDVFYDDVEARKYTTSSRIIEIQEQLTERAMELLALPNDGQPKFLLDLGCGSGLSGETLTEQGHYWTGFDISASMLEVAKERESEGDLCRKDLGQGLGLKPGCYDGAISISALQWLCNAETSRQNPKLRLKCLFDSLYKCLARVSPPSAIDPIPLSLSTLFKERITWTDAISLPSLSLLRHPHSSPTPHHTHFLRASGSKSRLPNVPGELCSGGDDHGDGHEERVHGRRRRGLPSQLQGEEALPRSPHGLLGGTGSAPAGDRGRGP